MLWGRLDSPTSTNNMSGAGRTAFIMGAYRERGGGSVLTAAEWRNAAPGMVDEVQEKQAKETHIT